MIAKILLTAGIIALVVLVAMKRSETRAAKGKAEAKPVEVL